MKQIKLYNRYRDNVYIESVDENTYELHVIDKNNSEEDFTRYGYDSWPDKIAFVDPSGGPYIAVGENHLSVYGDEKIKSVEFTVDSIYVTLSEDDKIEHTYLKISKIEFHD